MVAGANLTAPRGDTPYHLPDAPEPAATRKRRERGERRARRVLEVSGGDDMSEWFSMGCELTTHKQSPRLSVPLLWDTSKGSFLILNSSFLMQSSEL